MSRIQILAAVAALAAAGISPGQGCSTITLSGTAQTISCSPQTFLLYPDSNDWNVVAVASGANWSVDINGFVSNLVGAQTDFLIANGNLGQVSPASGTFTGGAASARVQWDAASTITLGTPHVVTFNAGTVAKIYQFNVTTTGTHIVMVNGSTDYFWEVYGPGTSASWRARQSSTFIEGNQVGGDFQAVSLTNPGMHALVIFASGSQASEGGTVAISVHRSMAPFVTPVAPGTVATNTAVHRLFELDASSGGFPVFGAIGNGSDWDIGLGEAFSSYGSGVVELVASTEYFTGTPNVNRGILIRRSGSDDATYDFEVSDPGTMNEANLRSMSGTKFLDALHFNVPSYGSYRIGVLGEPGLKWALFLTGSGNTWTPRSDATATGTSTQSMGTSYILDAGTYVLVAFRGNAGPSSANFVAYIGNLQPQNLTGSGTITAGGDVGPLSYTGTPDRFNAIAVHSASSFGIAMGNAYSNTATTPTEFVIADGRSGWSTSATGIYWRNTGTSAASIQGATQSVISLGNGLLTSWNSSHIIRLFEFEATTAGQHLVGVDGPSGLSWRLFRPSPDEWWQPATGSAAFGNMGTSSLVSLTPGWHAIVVYRNSTSVPSGQITVDVDPPNPVPVLSSLHPPARTIGMGGFTLTLTGTSFVSGAVAKWGGTSLTTTYNSSTQLTAAIPAALVNVAQGGLVDITVVNPVPGGGTSAARTFTLNNPSPAVTSLSPSSALAGTASPFALSVTGSGFLAISTVTWAGVNLPTSYVSSTQLQATVSTALLAQAGLPVVGVVTPAPGGGSSGGVVFTVNNPDPAISNLIPPSIPAGSPSITVLVNGSNFVPSSTLTTPNGLTANYVSATQLSVNVPASMLANPGQIVFRVSNPAPGGGSSSPEIFPIRRAHIDGVTPAAIPVLSAGSPSITLILSCTDILASTVVHANGAPLATSVSLATGFVTCTLPPSIPQTQLVGGIALTLANAGGALSNTIALVVGSGFNAGTIIRTPLAPQPGQAYSALIEGGVPGQPVTLVADPVNPAPITGYPTAAANMVISVGSPSTIPIVDGIGIFGPPTLVPGPGNQFFPIAFGSSPSGTPPFGVLTIPGFVQPNPPVGIAITVQAGYLDPSSPVGFRLTWARFPDYL